MHDLPPHLQPFYRIHEHKTRCGYTLAYSWNGSWRTEMANAPSLAQIRGWKKQGKIMSDLVLTGGNTMLLYVKRMASDAR